MVEELNVNAEFEVERPELGPIPDYSIFAEVKRTAEEQMLMRTGVESLLNGTYSFLCLKYNCLSLTRLIRRIASCSVKIFSLCLIGIIAHNAYRYVNDFKQVEFDNKYLT